MLRKNMVGYTPATVIIDSPVMFKDTKRDFTWKPHNYKEKFYGPTLKAGGNGKK
ncbi:MAG: hypothetical protein U9N77_09540 [Thermodesulfobacteriota bacterium]|nr:hypothetical protein [Thermodesulfobacteriota bacterium]